MFEPWVIVKDGYPPAYELMRRHYTFHDYKDGRRYDLHNRNRRLFCGPGEKLVLLSPLGDALFVWRKFTDLSGQDGLNCAVFRNESGMLSSLLILAAEAMARERWPEEHRLYTYVNAKKVKSSNPGYCFKAAGWHDAGRTKSKGLVILVKELTQDGDASFSTHN